MADRNAKVQDLIREQLQKNPGASTQELQKAAREIDSSVGELSLRQFNAGYVLPLKRRSGGGKRQARGAAKGRGGRGRKQEAAPARPAAAKPRRGARAAEGSDRDRVRGVLLQFARDLSEAESRSAIVGVVSDLDRYVDQIVAARG
jgi:hypothetical protein